MNFQERERKFQALRKEIKQRKKAITNLKGLTRVVVVSFIILMGIVFYMSAVAEIENDFTRISKFLLLILFAFLVALNMILRKNKHVMKRIDGKINVLINI
ncbi:hypothetical protein RQM59_00540 [Flavobacteriaceae bacterium S356]|uniref:Uncharacterized protein n=1 Tax=Asprobacillus argus TaxID=3076534 RepID=A0ABU3LCC9_9FLAO|nr:hypothetical protein [Flavobacteriaceae bacterium S356]